MCGAVGQGGGLSRRLRHKCGVAESEEGINNIENTYDFATLFMKGTVS